MKTSALALLVIAAAALGEGSAAAHRVAAADVAALQVGLKAQRLYAGPIDGVVGAQTASAIAALERRTGLPATGVFSNKLRQALGDYGADALGDRVVSVPASG